MSCFKLSVVSCGRGMEVQDEAEGSVVDGCYVMKVCEERMDVW